MEPNESAGLEHKINVQPVGLKAEVYSKWRHAGKLPFTNTYTVYVKITDEQVMKQPVVFNRVVSKQDFNDLQIGDEIVVNPMQASGNWYFKPAKREE